jgi:hypothetical protein
MNCPYCQRPLTEICMEQLAKGQLGLDRRAESILQNFARTSLSDNIKNNEAWEESARAEGRAIVFVYRLKKPMDTDAFNRWVGLDQKLMRDAYCAETSWLLRSLKATETHTHILQFGGRAADKLLNSSGRLPAMVAR